MWDVSQFNCGSQDGIGRSPFGLTFRQPADALAPQMHPRKRDAEIGRRRQAREMLVTSSKKVSAKFWTEFSADPVGARQDRGLQAQGRRRFPQSCPDWPAADP